MTEVEGSYDTFAPENAVEDSDQHLHDVLYKVIIIGDSGVGKTNILARWIENKFSVTSATINVEFATKCFQVDDKRIKIQVRSRFPSVYRFVRSKTNERNKTMMNE